MQNTPQIRVNPEIIDKCMDIPCLNCQHPIYVQVFRFKKLPALITNSGKEEELALTSFVCGRCGIQKGMVQQKPQNNNGGQT